MPLSDLVNVTITRNTKAVSQAGFGTLLIVGAHKRFNDRLRYYTSISSVAEDFRPTDLEYIAAQDAFSQNVPPERVAIGRRQVDDATIKIISAQDGIKYQVVINGFTSEATATGVSTAITIAAALTTAINANASVSADVLATANGDGTLTLTPKTASPYSVDVASTMINPKAAKLVVTQAIPSQVYNVRINGVQCSYTSAYNVQTIEEIAAGLTAAINAEFDSAILEATDLSNGSLEIESINPMRLDSSTEITSVVKGLEIEPYVASNSITDDLDAIEAASSDWYALACTERDKATVTAIADWIESRQKIFGSASDDLVIINQTSGADTTSVANAFLQAGYARSFLLYHQDASTDFPDCALFGECLPLDPGSETWMYKTLNGISYSNLSDNQSQNARNKNVNTYEFIAGAGVTREGKMASGEFIDIIRGIDWLKATIQTYVYQTLVNSPKIPYTDDGIAAIESQIRRALQQGIDQGLIAADPAPVISVPRAANVAAADKAARLLKNVTFQATLAGAIHIVKINGTIVL